MNQPTVELSLGIRAAIVTISVSGAYLLSVFGCEVRDGTHTLNTLGNAMTSFGIGLVQELNETRQPGDTSPGALSRIVEGYAMAGNWHVLPNREAEHEDAEDVSILIQRGMRIDIIYPVGGVHVFGLVMVGRVDFSHVVMLVTIRPDVDGGERGVWRMSKCQIVGRR